MMNKELFEALTVEQAREALAKYIKWDHEHLKVDLLDALGKLLAAEVAAHEDIPGFDRSTVDGYAIRASDSFGASEGLPAYFEIAGEVLMGEKATEKEVKLGQAWKIPTGGMLPPGADAVVMIEYTDKIDETMLEVIRPVAPWENVVMRAEDIACGAVVLESGKILKPQDIGVLAALGKTEAEVFPPLKVGVVSSGDEVVAPSVIPGPGQVRDINSYTICAQVLEDGGLPKMYGIVKDNFDELLRVMLQAHRENDLVLVSGGSSVGTRDVALSVINAMGKPGVIFHGLSLKPGKPAIGAVINGKPVIGLPGHPTSAMVVYNLMVNPLVSRRSYKFTDADLIYDFPVRARLTRNIRSAPGREEYIRVRLTSGGSADTESIKAEPVLGKSGLISTMVKSHGLAKIALESEGKEAGEVVEVKLYR